MAGSIELGQAIRDRRTEMGYTIEQAAARAGVGAKTWGRYEAGGAIRQDKVRVVARALGWVDLPVPGNTGDASTSSWISTFGPGDDGWSATLAELHGRDCAVTFAGGSDLVYDQISNDLDELARRPKGTHLGELDAPWLEGSLPAQFAMRYDYEFIYRLRSTVAGLRSRFVLGHVQAHSVLEEIALYLILGTADLFSDLYPEDFSPDEHWTEWLGDILGDTDIEMYLFDPDAVVPPGFTYHFDRWLEEQFWTRHEDNAAE